MNLVNSLGTSLSVGTVAPSEGDAPARCTVQVVGLNLIGYSVSLLHARSWRDVYDIVLTSLTSQLTHHLTSLLWCFSTDVQSLLISSFYFVVYDLYCKYLIVLFGCTKETELCNQFDPRKDQELTARRRSLMIWKHLWKVTAQATKSGDLMTGLCLFVL